VSFVAVVMMTGPSCSFLIDGSSLDAARAGGSSP
jgi:hypothetical protein